jgi:hypothetical protein
MTRDITKVKVTKDRTLEVELTEHLPDQTDREVTMKCDQLVHDDLVKAFDKLKVHLAIICELHEAAVFEIDLADFDPEEHLPNIKVTSFSIGGSGDDLGVTITGQKKLKSGKILNLNTPFIKYYDEIDPYMYAGEMAESIQGCVYEAEEYIFREKYAVKQLDLPFDEETGENSDGIVERASLEINKPKRGRKKKDYTIAVVSDDSQEHDVTDKF